MAGHRGFDAGLEIHSLGQLKISEGFGASEGNGAIQYLPLFAKDLEIFGKSVFGVLVAWERDGKARKIGVNIALYIKHLEQMREKEEPLEWK
jgi:hypothetical protein